MLTLDKKISFIQLLYFGRHNEANENENKISIVI